jgi:CubicO group peptidase (beta-lactamase class C family)
MGTMQDVRTWLPERLAQAAATHQVPGAAAAVLADGEIVEAAYGVLNRATGVEVTTDSLFQIGSITKVWTATLVMQLVDEGRLDLDAPVRRYLPGFRVADEEASACITARHLLSHTAGLEGDIFHDTGRSDDAIERYVIRLTDVPQLFPPGELFSYCNAGYGVLGRIIEVLRGKTYASALRDHLFGPLGLRHAATDADEAILHRAAVGHLTRDPAVGPEPAPVWALHASGAPAGSMLSMSAADLLRFARAHLDGGAAGDGTAVLSGASVDAMRQRQVSQPYLGGETIALGLAWHIFDWDGGTVFGHGGGTIGQAAILDVVPTAGVAVALLTNGGDLLALHRDLVGRALGELAGIRIPPSPVPPPDPAPVEPDRYAGSYQNQVARYDVTPHDDGRLSVRRTPRGLPAKLGRQVERYEIVSLAGDAFISAEPQGGQHARMAFVGADAGGRARFLHHSRAVPRVPD